MFKKLTLLGLLLITFAAAGTVCSAAELLQRTDFGSGISMPWIVSESEEAITYSEVVNGELMVHIDQNGMNRWDIQLRHREISIVAGHTYTVHFKLHANKSQKIYVKIGDTGDPYREVWSNNYTAFDIPSSGYLDVTETFTSSINSPAAEFAFHFGGQAGGGGDCSAPVPQEIYFTEMSLTDDQFVPTPAPTSIKADIRVNELGYYPGAAKKATLLSDSTVPVDVELRDSNGEVVWTGESQPKGLDVASGDNVHIINFSDFKTEGTGYRLFAGDASSFPFDIGNDLYSKMKYDALKYFYYVRSGIAMEMPYCADPLWSRPAGHPGDTATLKPNTPYQDGEYISQYIGGPESINTAGGWYDYNDDYSKNTVSGGAALWTMQNQYERARLAGKEEAYADGKLNIPESGNGWPDILDEARWNMEFMLKMQIPQGYSKAGMAVYRVGDSAYHSDGVTPDADTQERIFYPPTTSATLYLAATAAQASRLWRDFDPEFSGRCLAAAETAWEAAQADPDVFGYNSDYTYTSESEFYWAASELYASTGKSEYYDYINGSSLYCSMPPLSTDIYNNYPVYLEKDLPWAFGTITLALVPGILPEADINTAKAGIAALADTFISTQQNEGYGVPIQAVDLMNITYYMYVKVEDAYPIRSNSFIADECMIMGYAYEFSRDKKYMDGMTEAMDYLMGRNPIIKSYITGYGENPVKNPNNLLYTYMADTVPHGILVSGPASINLDQWVIAATATGTPAQKCYIDSLGSYSTNTVENRTNASLAWITGYLDENFQISTVIEDINGDRGVNMADIMLQAQAFCSVQGDGIYDEKLDLDRNSAINITDIMIVANKFNYTY